MVCKKQEQCKFGKMCGWAEDEETLLTECVEFIERVPLTNEEWFCELPTEEKAKWLEEKMTWAAQEQGTFTAKGWEKWLKEIHKE